MEFDAVVLGTGLAESIAAAALSKAGYKVAHVDNNQYYGGDGASLTLDELAEWADIRKDPNETARPSPYLVHQRTRYASISRSVAIPSHSRQYSVSLVPSIVPSVGPHIDSLILSGVSRYGSFKLLEKVAVYDSPGLIQRVPGSKEDVFKSKILSLVDKRRLMRFLMFAAGDFEGKKEVEGKEQMPFVQFLREAFSLNEKAASAIAYALAFCATPGDPTFPALQRIRQYLRSAGRYGASPFLVGHYGGLGETAQGFCRTSAVKGGTYILGRRVTAVTLDSSDESPSSDNAPPTVTAAGPHYSVRLEDFDEQLISKILISSPDYVPASLTASTQDGGASEVSATRCTARCIAIIDKPMVFTPCDGPEEGTPSTSEGAEDSLDGDNAEQAAVPTPPNHEVDTALLVFPPGCLERGSSTAAAHAIVTGEGTMSAPKGKWILNISLPLPSYTPSSSPSAEDLLKPYLDAALTLTAPPSSPDASIASPLFSVFYVHTAPTSALKLTGLGSGIIATPPCSQLLPAIADAATENAEAMFWKAVEQLKAAGVQRSVVKGTTMKAKDEAGGEDDDMGEKGSVDQEPEDIDSFWPPLDAAEDESADEW